MQKDYIPIRSRIKDYALFPIRLVQGIIYSAYIAGLLSLTLMSNKLNNLEKKLLKEDNSDHVK